MVGMRPTSSSARLLTKSLNAGEPTSTEAASTVKLAWLFAGRSKSICKFPQQCAKRPCVVETPTVLMVNPIDD
jgi:hypothetical protein